MDREKALDRIRRLLRLAESSNVNEAASAAARAQELMARARIESRDLEGDADGFRDLRDAPLDASKRLRPWKTQLAAGIARANGCRAYVLERAGQREIILVGRVEDAELVRMLYADLVVRVESLTRKHTAGRDRPFCNAFRLGAVVTLAERLALASAEARRRALTGADVVAERDPEGDASTANLTSNGENATFLGRERAALAIARLEADDDAIDRFMASALRSRPGRGLRVDAEGYAQGRMDGHSIALDEGSGP